MRVYPSILTDKKEIVQEQINRVVGLTDVVQIDIVDGSFADEITITPSDLVDIDFHNMRVDIHLLVDEPIEYIEECAQVHNIRTVIAQVEHMSSQSDFIQSTQDYHWNSGLSLDLYTPFSAIDAQVYKKLNIVQLMTIQAGAQGRGFQESVLPKIAEVVHQNEGSSLGWEIVVDGGIQEKTAVLCKQRGATSCVVGSYLWKSENISQSYNALLAV